MSYQKQFVYNFLSASYSYFNIEHNSGLAFLATKFMQGKGAFNDINISGIYSYRLKISHKSILNIALQTSYLQENVNSENFIYPSMINTYTGLIEPNLYENTTFISENSIDFSGGISYLSKEYRLGVSFFHIQNILAKSQYFKHSPRMNFHFAKVFSKNSFENSKNLIRFTPEIIYTYQKDFEQLNVGFTLEKNILLTRFWLQNNLDFSSISPSITIGVNLESIRLLYTYNIIISRFITLPISSNQISFMYFFKCVKKRNNKNTIYCTKL